MAATVRYTLDRRWTASKQDVERLLVNESLRRQQLQTCLLRNDRALLEIQSISDAQLISDLTSVLLGIRSVLNKTRKDFNCSQNDLHSYQQDFDRLKIHLFSHDERQENAPAAPSTNDPALQGSSLPDILHYIDGLRWQTESHKQTLSEKLALQRQLTTVEIELETERNQRAELSEKFAASVANEATLEALIRSLESMPRDKSQQSVAPTKVGRQSLEISNTVRHPKNYANSATKSPIDALESSLQNTEPPQVIEFKTKPHRAKVGFEKADDHVELHFHDIVDRRDTKTLLAKLGTQSTFSTTPFVKKIENRVEPRMDLLPRTIVEPNNLSVESPTQFATHGRHDGVFNAYDLDSARNALKHTNDMQLRVPNYSKMKGSHHKAKRDDDIGEISHNENLVLNAKEKSTTGNPAQQKRLQIKRKKTMAGPTIGEAPGRKRKILGGGSGGSILDDDEEDIHIVKNNIRRFEPKADPANEFTDLRLERRVAQGFNPQSGFSPRKRDKRST